jgi:dipeptidyl-peptidase-4
VAFAPVTDWTGYDAIYTEQYMGQLAENAHGYAGSLLPPVAGRLKGKLLLIHGTADQNVHLHHSFNLVDALVAAGKQIEMMLYPGMTHADFFRISPQGRQLFERITKFFVEHL